MGDSRTKQICKTHGNTGSDLELAPSSERKHDHQFFKVLILSLTGAMIMVLMVDIFWHTRDGTPTIHAGPLCRSHPGGIAVSDCSCGTSTRQALAMGCAFDQLAVAWLPRHCQDEELTKQFEHAGPGVDGAWTYYADDKGQQILNVTEVSLLADSGKPFFGTEQWHVMHCNYSWRKQLRAPNTGCAIEDRYYKIQHVEHCGMLVADAHAIEPNAVAVRAKVLLNSHLQDDDVGVIERLKRP